MKKAMISKGILFILAIGLFGACVTKLDRPSQMGNFSLKVEKIAGSMLEKVIISGENIDSALWIKEYRIIYGPDFVSVEIFRSLQKTGNNGSYLIEFNISSEIREIRIGLETVWKR